MAEEQIRTNVTIGVGVEGGDSAAQRLNKLALQLGALEKTAGAMRGLANLPIQFKDLIASSYNSAKGLEATKDQAKALKPAIQAIGTAVKGLGLPDTVLKSAGLDDKSLRAAGKNAGAFETLIENLSKTRIRAIDQAAASTGKAEKLSAELGIARSAAIREEVAAAKDLKAALRETKLPVAPAVPAIRAQALLGQGPLVSRARRPTAIPAIAGVTDRATTSLARETSAAKETAVAMKGLAEAKKQVVTGEKSVAASTGKVIDQLMKEMKAAPKAAAALHQMLRRMEAASNPKYARGFAQAGQSLDNVSRSAQKTATGFLGAARAGDSFLGQVKQVAVMATSFSILQGVAGKLQEGFHHLTGGIIGFNQMLERTQVGFNRLFANQAQQVEIARGFGDMTKEVEYLKMGYDSANAAAAGVVDTIRQFANVTPFRFEELAQATLRMRAFGFGLDEVLYKSNATESGFDGAVVAIGDAVSALGGGALEFQRITYALGQMKQAGRVYQNDMMQLANAGIGGYQYIADQLKLEITKNGSGQRADVKEQHKKLYDDLSNNTIETVRRLTTNGEISGEAASRAIIKGLKRDFGGGMKDFSRTFVGAWSTLADTSQSLVATAFEPFYKDLVKQLYDLGQFFQGPKAAEIAKSFQPIVQGITDDLFKLVRRVSSIVGKIVSDVGGAFGGVKAQFSSLGINGGDVLSTLRDGIIVITDLLQNDMTRSIITTSVAFASLLGFARSNPMLTAIMGIIFALGALRQAYIVNFLGFADAINGLVRSITPLINSIKEDLIPALGDVGAFVAQYIISGLIVAFKIAAPFIHLVVQAVAGLLKVIKPLAPLIAALVVALVTKFAYSKIVSGFQSVAIAIMRAAVQMRIFGREAKIASAKAQAASTALVPYGPTRAQLGVVPYGPTRAQLGAGPAPTSRFGSFMGGVGDNAMGIGLAGTIAASLAEMAGAPQEITSVVQAVSSALMGFGVLKQLFPGGVLAAIGSGLAGVALKFGTLLTSLGGGTLVANLSGLGPAIGALAGSFALGPAALLIAFAAAIGIAAAAVANGLNSINQDIPQVASAKIMQAGFEELREKFGLNKKGSEAPKRTATEIVQDRSNYERNYKSHKDEERNENMAKYKSFRDGSAAAAAKEAEEQRGIDKATKEEMDLLVAREKASEAAQARKNKLQEKYNRLLQQAQQNLQATQSALQDLATKTLQSLLDTNIARINPFTGLVDEALELEDVLRIQQEMLFTNFETITGTTKSFEEYADILDAIAPLQEKDRTEGKINLAAVTQRLKLEKERRRELELIRKNAEIEYDLGLATLQQYDDSVDPLQRAVNLRKAQAQYETDIRDSQMSGLELALDQATGSNQWAVAQKQTDAKLRDIEAGQSLILGEMERRFEVYNERVAAIMANPNFSEETRTQKLKEATDALVVDLETNFGVTKEKMDEQFALLNVQIGAARDATDEAFAGFTGALSNPTIPAITWGQSLKVSLDGAFNSIYDNMLEHFKKISVLAEKIKDVAAGGSGTPTPPKEPAKRTTEEGQKTLIEQVRARLMAGTTMYGRDKFLAIKQVVDPKINKLSGLVGNNAGFADQLEKVRQSLRNYGLRRGGMAMGGNPYLVGEGGPELFLPRSSGLVLNNSVSSRLMSMLTGRPDQAGSNVTINVNNPVIRNENDIRKLALEISRVQASQFRTEGGRL